MLERSLVILCFYINRLKSIVKTLNSFNLARKGKAIKSLTYISLFSSAGIGCYGFKQQGFKTINYHIDSRGKKRPYGNERVLTSSKLVKNFKKNNIHKLSLEYFRLFPNKDNFDNLLSFEKKFPKFLALFFTHYNYIGQKEG